MFFRPFSQDSSFKLNLYVYVYIFINVYIVYITETYNIIGSIVSFMQFNSQVLFAAIDFVHMNDSHSYAL